jgi:hypothetical protein
LMGQDTAPNPPVPGGVTFAQCEPSMPRATGSQRR